jgi:acyl-CoA thioester hydrolase
MNYTFKHKTNLRVRYGETDQMGYCYYGNYAQFFEVGRVEALRKIGFSYKDLEDQGIMLPVREFKVEYLRPAFYDDNLTVTTLIAEVKGAKITFQYEIENEKGELLSTATTILVFVRKDGMRPCPPPDHFLSKLSVYEQK